ncbi:hypothetical protein WJ542_16940 [Paraburkholderia sp. B3]|uniref:sulfotransferase family protein n=1 Tax=Paraburkholderia sp. B3 TaxID=3134791 RepID=UPI00398203FA
METMGASFGDNLMPPAAGNNPKGFFEDMDVAGLDIELMNAVGVDWHALPDPDFNRLTSGQFYDFRARALALLREKCQSGIFALKDPRVARLLPFWQPIFDELGARVLYVVAFRHPLSVARSLEARDSLTAEKSYLLWLAHVVPALRYSSRATRAFVNYDTMMEAPRDTLERLSAELNLPLDTDRLEAFERDFLEKGLRHTCFGPADLEQDGNAPSIVKLLFGALKAFAEAPSSANAQCLDEMLSRAEAFLADTAPLLARDWQRELDLHTTHQHVDELEHAVSTQTVRTADIERELVRANGCVTGLEQERQTAHARIEVLEQDSRLAHTRIETLEQDSQLAHARIEVLEQDLQMAHTRIETLEENGRTLETVTTAQQRELNQALTTLSEVLGSTSWRVTAPLRAVRRCFSH